MAKLTGLGWQAIVLWECELGKQKWLADTLVSFLGAQRCDL